MSIEIDKVSQVQRKPEQGKIFIDWETYINQINKMCFIVRDKGFKSVAGLPRGGLIPAVMVSHSLNIPLVSIEDADTETLIVDDICDSGNTLKRLNFKQPVAVLHKRYNSEYHPTYIVETIKTDDWIIYPYEQCD